MNQASIESYEFESLNLQVGGRIQFISHREIKPIQHFSTLIGYLKDDYLIVKTPTENDALVVAHEGDKLTIRIFSGISVCWFSCTIMRIFPRPLNYMHLSFPTLIQGTRLRAAMRVKVDIAALLAAPGSAMAATPVSLINLSSSGALLKSPTQLPANVSAVNLSFTVNQPDGNPWIDINTRVTIQNMNTDNSAPNGQDETFTYGLQFVDLDPMQHVMLQNLTYEAFIDDRTRIV